MESLIKSFYGSLKPTLANIQVLQFGNFGKQKKAEYKDKTLKVGMH